MTHPALKVVVAEDEPLARERLVRLLEEAGCTVETVCEDGCQLLEWIRSGASSNGLFLDVHMPGATGFEVLAEAAPDRVLPPLVFVSAFPEYALRAFEVRAVDYLLKPVTPERLAESLARLQSPEPSRTSPAPSPMPRHPKDRFPAKAGEGHVILDLRRVSHFEVVREVVWAYAQGRRFRTNWRSLAEVEEAFPAAALLRVQRHVLLRPEAVLALKPLLGGRSSARVGEGIDVEVSRSATSGLKGMLGLKA